MHHETDQKPNIDDFVESALTLDHASPLLFTEISWAVREKFVYSPTEAEALLLGEAKHRKRWGKHTETSDERTARIEAQREKTEEIHTKVQTGIEELSASLAAGKSEQLLALLDAVSRFHSYSVGNTFLILLQQPEATHVAGFTTWKELGRYVRAGEAGIAILAPIPKRIKVAADADDSSEDRDAKATKTVEGSGVWGFKVVYVFDVSQTEGKPLPRIAAYRGDPENSLSLLKEQVRAAGITIEYCESLDGSYGRSRIGAIDLITGLSPAQEFGTLVHEFAHELLHSRKERSAIPKAIKETEAEAVAYVVSRAIGLEPGTASSDYIQLYRGDTDLLTLSLDRIQKTAAYILDGLEVPE